MKVKHLRTVGDGFCYNHYWPMWSQLLADVLDCEWKNFSLPGLGNEAMANIVIDQLSTESLPDTLWVVQWAAPNRVDFRVDSVDQEFLLRIEADPIYYKNFITTAQGRQYWASGASVLPWVEEHRNLISHNQPDRLQLYQSAVMYHMQKHNVEYQFISTPEMMNFRNQSQYKDLDVGEIQPVSSIHLDFLQQFVLPKISYDSQRFEQIRDKILQHDQARRDENKYVPWDRNMHKRV